MTVWVRYAKTAAEGPDAEVGTGEREGYCRQRARGVIEEALSVRFYTHLSAFSTLRLLVCAVKTAKKAYTLEQSQLDVCR